MLIALSPSEYLRGLGFEPYDWQVDAIENARPHRDRLLICAARQSGKSTIVGGRALHIAKYEKNALSLIVCPAKDQSAELMQKVTGNMALDKDLSDALERDGITLKEFRNRSRIAALPGTERSVRGYSNPRQIILDEAARVLDETYMALRPMMSRSDSHTDIIAITTAFGRRGWFYRAWNNTRNAWRKILVRIPWDLRDGRLVDAMPEDEFKAYWKAQGVNAYYSTAHNPEQLEADLEEMDPLSFRQEYCCEFLEDGGGLFNYDDIMGAFYHDQMDAIQMLGDPQEAAFETSDARGPLEIL